MPIASVAEAMLDAVPMVMQVPKLRAMPPSISSQSFSVMLPARFSVQYFHTSVPLPRLLPRQLPRNIGPAGTKIAGKFMLAAHLTFSVGWIGAVIAYLALVVAAMTSQGAHTLRSAWVAMELIGWKVIVPLSIGSVITGLIMALGTPWGLFRHYWVLFSLVLTIFATVVLLTHMQTVSLFAYVAAETDSAVGSGLRGELLQ